MATSYGLTTKMKAPEILAQTVAYFGPDGLGLRVTEQGPCCLHLEGGAGFVDLRVSETGPVEVELVLHELENHAVSFMRTIKK